MTEQKMIGTAKMTLTRNASELRMIQPPPEPEAWLTFGPAVKGSARYPVAKAPNALQRSMLRIVFGVHIVNNGERND